MTVRLLEKSDLELTGQVVPQWSNVRDVDRKQLLHYRTAGLDRVEGVSMGSDGFVVGKDQDDLALMSEHVALSSGGVGPRVILSSSHRASIPLIMCALPYKKATSQLHACRYSDDFRRPAPLYGSTSGSTKT